MNELKTRISSLLQQLNERVFEKEHIIALSLLSAVAGENLFLLGPPGVAKSMVARRLKLAFRHATSFEYLMSRFSTPDEIFGPVSISKLKDEDTYERVTEGYLPTATIAFLDEIWKAGPAIQNALLTIINEKVYRNGQVTLHVPLKGLVAASNELPAQGQGLEALWDRFLIRCLVTGIEARSEFERMIISTDESDPVVDESLSISEEEYAEWAKQIAEVKIPDVVLEVIHSLREQIEQHNLQMRNDGGVAAPVYVSDRRWKKIIKLLRTSAFLNGADTIHLSDCLLLAYCLWNESEQIEIVENMLAMALRKGAENYLLDARLLDQEIEDLRICLASGHGIRESHDPGIEVVDSYYYQIEGVRMKERLLLFVADYQHLDKVEQLFYLHKDKYKSNCCVLKKYDAILHAKVPRNRIYTLKRGLRSVFINDYEYHLMCYADCAPPPPEPEVADLNARCLAVSEVLQQADRQWNVLRAQEEEYYKTHLFLSEKQRSMIHGMLVQQKNVINKYKNEWSELEDARRKEDQDYQVEKPENDLFAGVAHPDI